MKIKPAAALIGKFFWRCAVSADIRSNRSLARANDALAHEFSWSRNVGMSPWPAGRGHHHVITVNKWYDHMSAHDFVLALNSLSEGVDVVFSAIRRGRLSLYAQCIKRSSYFDGTRTGCCSRCRRLLSIRAALTAGGRLCDLGTCPGGTSATWSSLHECNAASMDSIPWLSSVGHDAAQYWPRTPFRGRFPALRRP